MAHLGRREATDQREHNHPLVELRQSGQRIKQDDHVVGWGVRVGLRHVAAVPPTTRFKVTAGDAKRSSPHPCSRVSDGVTPSCCLSKRLYNGLRRHIGVAGVSEKAPPKAACSVSKTDRRRSSGVALPTTF